MTRSLQTARWLVLVQWLGISLSASMPYAVWAANLESAPAPVESAPASVETAAPTPVSPVVVNDPAATPAIPEPVVVESAPDAAAATTSLEAAEPQPLVVTPTPDASENPTPTGSVTYVNPQDFNLGTSQPTAEDWAVVLSERSTGCQVVLPAGVDVPHNLCPPPAAKTAHPGDRPQSFAPERGNYERSYGSAPVSQLWGKSSGDRPSSYLSKLYQGANPLKWLGLNGKHMLFPLAMPSEITSAFGWRLNPISGFWRMHSGTDLGAPLGTPVLAVQTGQVLTADDLGGYGLTVILGHNQHQQETLYGHLSEILVNPGQQVKQGEVIGLVGSTGNSTGPHLHFEILQRTPEGMVAVDPGPKLTLALTQLRRGIQLAQAKTR